MSEEEQIFQCPECLHPNHKLYINVDKGVFHCYHCDFSGKLYKLKKYPNILDKIQDRTALAAHLKYTSFNTPTKKTEDLDIDLKKLHFIEPKSDEYTYLSNRGWTDEMFDVYFPMRSDEFKFEDRVILPIYDKKDVMSYYIARHMIRNDNKKYLNAEKSKDDVLFFNQLSCNVVYKKLAFIVEGAFDSAKLPCSVALLGKTVSKGQEQLLFDFLRNKKDIYICLDKDAEISTQALVAKISSWYPASRIHTLNHIAFEQKDVGDLSKSKTSHELLKFIVDNSVCAPFLDLTSCLKKRLLQL